MNKLEEISRLKEKLDKSRPLDKITLDSILEDLKLKYTYHSNALEGNTLSIYETKVIIEHGITIGGKTIREHLEVINHNHAVDKLIMDVQNDADLDLKLILDYHHIILHGINDEWAGRYRNSQVFISGAKHVPPNANKVFDKMNEFINMINNSWGNLHPVESAALIHAYLVQIHPFVDGNGRTARLIMNLHLMKYGYPIIIIELIDKAKYCALLDSGHIDGNYTPFVDFIAECVRKSLNIYLNATHNT